MKTIHFTHIDISHTIISRFKGSISHPNMVQDNGNNKSQPINIESNNQHLNQHL